MDFSSPPLQMAHMLPVNSLNAGGGTLRRGVRGIVPPDVTHHTNHKSTHDLQNSMNLQQQQIVNSNNPMSSQLSNNSVMTTPKQPPGILKDPNRKQQQLLSHSNVQILNVQNAPGIGSLIGSVGGGSYEPNTHNLSSFNASLGYSDADGHLV